MNIKLPAPAENALAHLQDTTLNPMEEALFKTWAKANQIQKPDAPDDHVDYRGIYKETGGAVMPNGALSRYAEKLNSQNKLQTILQERMAERIQQTAGTQEQKEQDQFKAERQDIGHKQKLEQGSQKLEMEQMKLKQQPHEIKLREHDAKAGELDIEKQKIGNEGKQIDMIANLLKPAGATGGTGATASTGKSSAESKST